MGGHDPYSSSKGCAELVTAAYRNAPSCQRTPAWRALATARAGNVDRRRRLGRDRLVPDILRALRAGQAGADPQPARHPPLAARAGAARRLPDAGRAPVRAKAQAFAEGWNFGPHDDDARPVQWIVEHLVRQLGRRRDLGGRMPATIRMRRTT